MAAIGYAWRLTGAPFDMPFVTRIIMYVAGPCLVFTSLSQLTLPLARVLEMVGAIDRRHCSAWPPSPPC